MEAQIWSSELAVCSNYNYTEKAWHLASILLLIGKPASPAELVAKCSLFRTSPEFVEFLCSIPNSPIYLTANNFVVLSMSAFSAVGEFFASSMPKIEIRSNGGERMFRTGDDFVRRYFRKRKKLGSEIMPVMKKRAALRSVDENERETANLNSSQRILNTCYQGVDQQTDTGSAFSALSFGRFPVDLENVSDMFVTPTMVNSSIELLEYQQNIDGDQESGNKHKKFEVNDMVNCVVKEEHQNKCYANSTLADTLKLDDHNGKVSKDPLLETLAEISAMLEDNLDVANLVSRIDNDIPICPELDQHDKNLSVESTSVINAAKDFRDSEMPETKIEDLNEQPVMDNGGPGERVENILSGSWRDILCSADKLCQTKMENSIGEPPPLKKDQTNVKSTGQPLDSADPQPSAQMAKTKSSVLKNVTQAELTQKQKTPSKLMKHNKVDIIHKERRQNKHRITIAMMDKSKHIARNSAPIEEKHDNGLKSSKEQQKPKFPEFESYTVEEEEGSGGYGTVYRARRKSDGLTFAIKCPHANAHKQHVKNELKMLERFGGRNYVIRYEGSLKSETSDCFVLEHVAHDRPEVLKREMDISQLQWYGFCMLKALVSLHKQGVFHRDIKPGNFLFSCKSQKGYLIDFNLARDMNQKHGSIEKSQPSNVTAIQHILSGQFKPTSPNKQKKLLGAPESKTLKKKPVDKLKAYEDLGRCNPLTSQGADGSGLTSARDMSTRTPSAERLREPLPCKGRKALINIAQEAMQSPNHGPNKAPSSNRKRVAASPGITDRKLIYPTPTPLHSSGIAISGAGSLKFRGEVKPNKEGPCAGTKGFRAPEVLLRSLHQGPKVDVWSVGVTLLFLISGRMPFNGDPEQNMKDIVKLRGNEELWEVAKLHNCESSFPVELLDIRFLPAMTIRHWYLTNTKRQDFLEVIPDSLFDLLEKCLTVSPRLRISAEEALNHEFFAPCHEAFHRQRSSRRGQNYDSKSNSLPSLGEPVRPSKEKLIAPVNF